MAATERHDVTPTAAAEDAPDQAQPMRSSTRLFQLAVTIGSIGWLVAIFPRDLGPASIRDALFFAITVTLVDLIPVPAWGGMQLSVSFPILLAAAILFPPPLAGLVAFAGSIDPRELRLDVSPLVALFNRAQVGLSILCGSLVFHSLATIHSRWYLLLPAVMLTSVVAYASNTLTVACGVSLQRRIPLLKILAKMHGVRPWEFLLSYLGLGLFGVVIAHFYLLEGIWPVVVFLAPLIFARQMYFRSRSLADQLTEQNALLAEQASRLEQLLQKEYQTVGELRELNQMKGEFVAVVSHELRTPVTALIGYAKTLQQQEFAEDPVLRQEFLERMERQGDRLLRLVENLLTASRLEAHELPISIGRVLFEDVCREVVEGLTGDTERVLVEVPDHLPVLHTDRQLLSRVVTNLIDNALKYSPDGAHCELGARGEEDQVVFWVRDHGIGIPPEQVDRIFERFYQVDSSSTRTFRGAGLGLALVADLMQHLGGRIEVHSVPNEGSTFTVYLPVEFPGSEGSSRASGGDEQDIRTAI
jgi:signal transduction histidine kinase